MNDEKSLFLVHYPETPSTGERFELCEALAIEHVLDEIVCNIESGDLEPHETHEDQDDGSVTCHFTYFKKFSITPVNCVRYADLPVNAPYWCNNFTHFQVKRANDGRLLASTLVMPISWEQFQKGHL